MNRVVAGALLGAVATLATHYLFLRGDLWLTQNAMATDLRACQDKLVRLPPGTYKIENAPWGDGGILFQVPLRPMPEPEGPRPP